MWRAGVRVIKQNKIIFLAIVCGCLFIAGMQSCSIKQEPIRVGILHSLSGTMAFSEKSLLEALTLAIEEVNDNGGVLGRAIMPIVVDGQSDWDLFAKEAERLIVEEKVSVIFGCWTSACRKAVKPVIEKYRHLFFYPMQYEGMEQSPDIVYTGVTPNQQITPTIAWALEHLGKNVLLVGSDYLFPRMANQIIKDLLQAQHGKVLAEHYLALGSSDVDAIIKSIKQHQPDVILNTINGDSNIAFFKALSEGLSVPVLSYSLAEPEVAKIGANIMQGHYAAWSYFQSVDRPENSDFVTRFKQRFGQQRVINDPMEASYIGLHLWVKAVEHAQSFDPRRVKDVIGKVSLNAPQGIVSVDSVTHHLWKTARIGKVGAEGQFEIVWQSDKPVRPVLYPFYRSKKAWQQLLAKFSARTLAL